MGKARQRRKPAGQPSAGSLAAAWLAEDGSFAGLFEQVLRGRSPMDAISDAVGLIDDGDKPAFSRALFSEASGVAVTLKADGRPALGIVDVFTFSAHGPEASFAALAMPGLFDRVARFVRRAGFAHEESNVVVCSIGLDPLSAADVMPDAVRTLAEAFALATTGGSTATLGPIMRRLSIAPQPPAGPSAVRIVTRLFVGARLRMADGKADLFDAPKRTGDEEEDNLLAIVHAGESAQARDGFEVMAAEFSGENGLDLVFHGPERWTDGIGAMGQLRLTCCLALEAVSEGKELKHPDEVHYAFDGDSFWVLVKDGASFYGPVDIPAIMATYGMEAITEWFTEGFGAVVAHDSLGDLNSVISCLRH
jgi:hypothetical protein